MRQTILFLGLLAAGIAALPGRAALRGPYAVDAQTLHLWHLNDTNASAVDSVSPPAGTNLTALVNGATLNNASFGGFGTALSTFDGGQAGGGTFTARDAVLSARPPANGSSDNVAWSFADPVTGAFTYEAIVRVQFNPLANLGPTNIGGTGRGSPLEIIVGDQDDTGGGVRSWQLRIDPVGYTIGAVGYTNPLTQAALELVNRKTAAGQTQRFVAAIPTNGPDAILSNGWYHLAATYNGAENTSNNFKLYWTLLNGSRTNASLILSDNMLLDLDVGAVDFTLGNSGRGGTPTNNFLGLIDEVRLSSVARAASEMQFFVPVAPMITQQPTNKTVMENHAATFTAAATGDPAPTFQWRRNGGNLQGATNASYTLPNPGLANNGDGFSVRIANSAGSVTSVVATLSVQADTVSPTVLRVSNTPNLMQVIVIFSEAMDAGTVTDSANYSLSGGVVVLGAALAPDGSNVTLNVSTLAEGVSYMLTVFSVFDRALNPLSPDPTFITFQAAIAPMITMQPQNQAVPPGGTAMFHVTASGTAPLNYQWYKGNLLIVGQGADLTIANVQPANLGNYKVVVGNSAGAVTSAFATLSFQDSYTLNLPVGYSFLAKQLDNAGLGFSPVPEDTQLYKWNVALQSYSLSMYSLGVWSPAEPTLAVGEGFVLHLPAPTTLTFTGAKVTPVLPVSLAPGLNLLGAQSPIRAGYQDIVGPPEEGSILYRFKSTGDLTFNGTNFRRSFFRDGMWHDHPPVLEVGESAFVGVMAPVVIVTQPAGQTNIAPGQGASFFVEVTGTGPFHYQWRLNGTFIPGATGSNYSIAPVGPGQAGSYSVSVGNAVGDILSVEAPLTLDVPAFPLTDDFAAQIAVNDFSRLLSSHNRNATMQPGEPAHVGKTAGASVWLTWVAPADGIVTMSTAGSSFDTLLAAYHGNTVSNLTPVGANDDGAGYACSLITFNAKSGFSYQICVAGLGDGTGDILLGWDLEVTTALLPEILVQPQDTVAAFGGPAQFTVVTTNGNYGYQWYRDGVPIAGATAPTLTINSVGDSDVAQYHVQVFNAGRSRNSELVSLQAEFVEDGQPLSGSRFVGKFFDLNFPAPDGTNGVPLKGPPARKLIGGAISHGYSYAVGVPNTYSPYGKDPGEPNNCLQTGGNSVWYNVRATNHGTMYVSTEGSSYDTLLSVYVGPGNTFATLTNVTCNDNAGLYVNYSSLNYAAVSNTIYYFAVDGASAASGMLKFAYHLTQPLILTNLVYTNYGGGEFRMKVLTTPTLTNVIQYRTNFTSTNWVSVLTNTTSTNFFLYTNSTLGGVTNRYYRAYYRF